MTYRLRLRTPSLPTAISLLALAIASTGTAYAAGPQLFSLADHQTPSHVAVVSAGGALKIGGSVTTAPHPNAFVVSGISFEDGSATAQFNATKATLAFTGIRIANGSPNQTTLSLYEYGQTSATCSSAGPVNKFLGEFAVPVGQTVDEQLAAPMVIGPLAGKAYWCFITFASGSTGSGFYTTFIGYTLSGAFSPGAIHVTPGREGHVTRADLHQR